MTYQRNETPEPLASDEKLSEVEALKAAFVIVLAKAMGAPEEACREFVGKMHDDLKAKGGYATAEELREEAWNDGYGAGVNTGSISY